MCDIDHFKHVNDTYGHPAGDQVLIRIGQILLSKLRNTDIVARYGGEEFGVILLNASDKVTFRIAEELRRAVAESTVPEL